MICPKCINTNNDGATVCAYCGNPLTTNTNVVNQNVVEQNSLNENYGIPVETKPKKEIDFNKIFEFIKKYKFIFIGIVGVIALILIIMGLVSLFNPKETNKAKEEITYVEVFFLENKDNKYALFSDSGKQLTEFIYTYADSFINGTALVKNEDDEKGVINTSGKMVIPFGKYKYLYSESGLYTGTTEDYKKVLIDGKGNEILSLEDADVSSYTTETFVTVETEKEHIVYLYNGKKVYAFPKVEDVEDPSVNEEDGYITVFYNDKTIVFKEKTGKIIATIDGNVHYCVNAVSEDGKLLTFNSCVKWFESQETVKYRLVKNGKVHDLTGTCDGVSIRDNLVTCTKDRVKYLLNDDLTRGIEITSDVAYIDNKTYAKYENVGIDFYQNNKLVKHVDGDLKNDGYVNGMYIRTIRDGKIHYAYYKSNGEQAFKQTFATATDFDDNGLAVVSDNGEKFYLINKKGKKISEEYKAFNIYGDHYLVYDGTLKGLINKKGKTIIDLKYTYMEVSIKNGEYYALGKTEDGKYDVIDVDKGKVIATFDKQPTLTDHYIKYSGDKTEYHSYNGKKFYEE